MDPVSNSDRLVRLLKQKLRERAKAGSQHTADAKTAASQPERPSAAQTIAALDGADDHQVRRAFVQHLLADQLGPALINDAQFQGIVSRVTEAMEEDADALQLLSRLISEFRAS
jgi:methylmalonyl-CoA mutase cobalamin-binding subunit